MYDHFNVDAEAPQRQLLAWRERVGHIIDVLPSREQVANPFHASIDRYNAGPFRLTDCSSDALLLERSLARISTDNVREFGFHLFLDGGVEPAADFYPQRGAAPSRGSIVAVDLSQPMRMQRSACRVLSFFAPQAMVESMLPDADALHRRVIGGDTPLANLLTRHLIALSRNMRVLGVEEVQKQFHTALELLLASFGKQAGLSGGGRMAARSAMSVQLRRYIDANLHRPDLTPDSLLAAVQLPRPSVYRIFEHEGGLASYIRQRRLLTAAAKLTDSPGLSIAQIAIGLGFVDANDFGSAFRRAYAMTPQDFRVQVQENIEQRRQRAA